MQATETMQATAAQVENSIGVGATDETPQAKNRIKEWIKGSPNVGPDHSPW